MVKVGGFWALLEGGIDLEKVVLIFGIKKGLRFLKREKSALGELKKCV